MFLQKITIEVQEWIKEVQNLKGEEDNLLFILNNRTERIYENLNLSVLTGEYLDSSGCINTIKEIENLLNTLIEDSFSRIKGKHAYNIHHIKVHINYSLNEYKNFIETVSKSEGEYSNVLFGHLDSESVEMYSLLSLKDQKELFTINLDVAYNDHFLPSDVNRFKELVLRSIRLENLDFLTLRTSDLIFQKCNYLLGKIRNRIRQEVFEYSFLVEGISIEISSKSFETHVFHELEEKQEIHYNPKKNQDALSRCYDEFIVKNKRFLQNPYKLDDHPTLLEFIHATKYYKNILESPLHLEALLEDFIVVRDEEIKSELSKYDKHSFDLILNYIYNNLLSLLIKKSEKKEKILDTYNGIYNIQKETRIHNYFPHMKICKYLSGCINSSLEDHELNIEEVKNDIRIFNTSLKRYRRDLMICLDKNFHPIRLTRAESLIEFDYKNRETGDSIKISLYLASGISWPIVYKTEEETLNKMIGEQINFNNLIKIQQAATKTKEIINQVVSDVKKSEIKYIEILGIFSALVLFGFGNIQFYTTANLSIKEAIVFSLFFSYSIAMFVLLIWMISRDRILQVSWFHKTVLIGLIAMWVATFLYFMEIIGFSI